MEKPCGQERDGGDSDTSGNVDDAGPFDYDLVEPLARKAIKDTAHMKAMTYNPKTNRIYDLDRISQALALFMEIVWDDGGMNPNLPIYLV